MSTAQGANRVENRLRELGLQLPQAPTPIANFVPYRITGNLVFLAGQVNEWNGHVQYIGKVGADFDVETGKRAAEICALNLLAALKLACNGNLDRVRRCIRLGGFVNCTPDFAFAPAVVNGASDLIVQIWGEDGRHARTAVGVASLPRNAAVEVDAIFEIE